MNAIMKMLWMMIARKRLEHENLMLRYPAIDVIGKYGNFKDFLILLDLINNSTQEIGNLIGKAIKTIIKNHEEKPEVYTQMRDKIIAEFNEQRSLYSKIIIIDILSIFSISIREELLASLVLDSGNDLQYQVIHSLRETVDISILDDVLSASETVDLVLKRKALQTWYHGLENQEFDGVISYCTKNLHALIRATYEMQLSGEFLKKVLSYSNQTELPPPKAYPDFIIRYMNELLGQWEYDPEANRSVHAIMVPSYFTFDNKSDTEAPFIIL